MSRDAWAAGYASGMASERRSAAQSVADAQRQLDIALADPKVDVGHLFNCWITLRVKDALHRTIVDRGGHPTPLPPGIAPRAVYRRAFGLRGASDLPPAVPTSRTRESALSGASDPRLAARYRFNPKLGAVR